MGEALDRPDFDTAVRFDTDQLDGGLRASPPLSLSNAPMARDPAKGAPFGGLMAALCLTAARRTLGVDAPLRTLTVQFLSGARFEPVEFTAETLRGGRSTLYAQVRAGQPDRPALASLLTFGDSGPGPSHRPLTGAPPIPAKDLTSTQLDRGFAPWFTGSVEYRFIEDPGLFGRAEEAVVRVWLRVADAKPLDERRLCFLLDAVFPNYLTVTEPSMSATADLRYDLFGAIGPGVSPEGWAYFEFRTRDCGDGWAVEDGVATAPDGTPLAVARQLRKVLAQRGSQA
jgi:hypothetical protein